MTGGDSEPADVWGQPAAPHHPDRLDLYLARRAGGAGPIYFALLTVLLLMGAALPVVRIPTFVTGRGVVRAELDSQVLVAVVGGTVVDVIPRDRYFLRAGDTVLRLERADLVARQRALHEKASTLEREAADLLAMIAWSDGDSAAVDPQSLRFGADWYGVRGELASASARVAVAAREGTRALVLLERSLASVQEVEALRDRVQELRRDSALLMSRAADRWRGELAALRAEITSVRVEQAALAEQVDLLTLRAPMEGWLDAVAALSPGSYLSAGARVATITPLSPLIAELYVDPADVDRIRAGHSARLLPQSHRYSGTAPIRGRVDRIFPDLVRAGDAAVARVHVRLDGSSFARAPVTPAMRRGDAIQARFQVGRRSLWELLRRRREELNRPMPVPEVAFPSSMG